MFFSVLIPVYQVNKYLRSCIDSVLNQSEQDFEIILVDDGSTDGSEKICDEYVNRFPQIIRVIHQENKGLLLARRTAIKAARGDWFVHLDSDDYMLPNALEAIRKKAEQNETDLILCKVAYGKENGIEITHESELPFRDNELIEEKKKLFMQFLYGGQITAIYQKIAKRDIIDINMDYSKWQMVNIMEDHLQSMPLLDQCERPLFLDQAIVYYRIHDGGMTKQKKYDDMIVAFQSVRCVYEEEKHYRKKWELNVRENSMICAKHMRKYCALIQEIISVTTDQDKLKDFLKNIKEDNIIQNEFETADRRIMGRKTYFCFQMIRHNLFFALDTLFAVGK